MTIKKVTFVIFMIMGSAYCTFAQITFQNNNRESVIVAFARYVNKDSTGFWVTKGWSTVMPGSAIKAFDAIGAKDSIGFFAITRISETPYPGTKNLLVHINEQFLIKNADQELVLQRNPDYEWRLFRLVKFQPGKTFGTISFKD